MLPTFSPNLTLLEAFETAAQINEELKLTEFVGAYRLINRFSSFLFAKLLRRKFVEKMIQLK